MTIAEPGGEGRLRRHWAAVDRFASACEADDAVLAAFLGGSLAAGTADEESDLDVYAVIRDENYDEFLEGRERFLRSWGDLVFSTEIRNFENLGFDMVLFVMGDGVEGELALATADNFRAAHGGPHRVLVDKTGILSGVEFPLLPFDERSEQQEVERVLWWFWWQVRGAVKAWVRTRWWAAASQLKGLRDSCLILAVAANVDDPRRALAPTFAPLDRQALATAILTAVRCYVEWGPLAARAVNAHYPEGLVRVSSERVTRTIEGSRPGRRT